MSSKLSRGSKGELFNILPAGVILPFAGETAPAGWALCDGTILNRSEYPELFQAIGTAWGSPDANTFNLPDTRGKFLRGVDGTAGVDPDKASRTASNAGGNIGDAVGSIQGDAIRNITGTFSEGNRGGFADNTLRSGAINTSYTSSVTGWSSTGRAGWSSGFSFNASAVVPTGGDNRPINSNINYIIKL